MKIIIMVSTLVLITNKLQPISADYELGVQLRSYSNPSNLCEGIFCFISCECDNKFTFCLRPSGNIQDNNPSNCPLGIFETRQFDDQDYIDFNQTIDLGDSLPNPFFYRNSGNWPGQFQLYVQVLDFDPANDNDVIDNIYVDMALTPSPSFTTPQTFVGNYGNGKLEMSFRVQCTDGYSGNTCQNNNECTDNTDNCDMNALCINTPESFTCTCNPGYTGDGVTCIDNNECTLNTDNCHTNALCTNTPGSFNCTCNQGYTGDGVTCTVLSNMRSTDEFVQSNSSLSVGPIIGGIVGVLLIALLVVIIVVVIVSRKEGMKKQIPEPSKEQSNEDARYTLHTIIHVDNSIYEHVKDDTSDNTSDNTHDNVNDHTSDNTYEHYVMTPIYEEITSPCSSSQAEDTA